MWWNRKKINAAGPHFKEILSMCQLLSKKPTCQDTVIICNVAFIWYFIKIDPISKVTYLKRGHLCQRNLSSGVEVCKLFGVSLLTETQHGPWKREETDPTQEHMHVLYKKVYSLYIYLFITWCVLKFSTSEILGWKYKSGGKGLHSTLKNKKHNSLSFHITTEEAGLGHGDGRPFFSPGIVAGD